ncbi:PQQ-binding-like beta-propeller repeat protein [Pontibacter sp. G13]|uniref:outer membrane protein assembly factor BamB family protein n=1 Tax=Pontibacter sp. G13 TaxID=3074898 RepID=UPI002889B9FB|nr:PQQ-binding-like beta-propeller repeat protein [Pontibacter sp. G13]WNJ18432.1 PQQ-binding-like beta-propeller repeat protein [Pontibacter sp. G13]
MAQVTFGINLRTSFNPAPKALVPAGSGSFLIAGRAFNDNQPDTGFALLYNPNNGILPIVWEQTYGSTYSTMFLDAAQLSDGNFIGVGIMFTSIYSGDENLWIVKMDAKDGSVIWEKNFGTPGVKRDGYAVAATSDGGFVVSAIYLDKSGDLKTQVIKYDGNGNQSWEVDLDTGVAYSMIPTSDGSFVLSGATPPDVSGNNRLFVAKVSGDGKLVWNQVYDQFEAYIMLQSGISELSNGDFAVCGKSIWLKIAPNGSMIWGFQNDNLILNTVEEMPDQSLSFAGALLDPNGNSRAYVVNVSPTGSQINWDNTEIESPSSIAQIQLTPSKEVIGTGSTPLGGGSNQLFLAVFHHAEQLAPNQGKAPKSSASATRSAK